RQYCDLFSCSLNVLFCCRFVHFLWPAAAARSMRRQTNFPAEDTEGPNFWKILRPAVGRVVVSTRLTCGHYKQDRVQEPEFTWQRDTLTTSSRALAIVSQVTRGGTIDRPFSSDR